MQRLACATVQLWLANKAATSQAVTPGHMPVEVERVQQVAYSANLQMNARLYAQMLEIESRRKRMREEQAELNKVTINTEYYTFKIPKGEIDLVVRTAGLNTKSQCDNPFDGLEYAGVTAGEQHHMDLEGFDGMLAGTLCAPSEYDTDTDVELNRVLESVRLYSESERSEAIGRLLHAATCCSKRRSHRRVS